MIDLLLHTLMFASNLFAVFFIMSSERHSSFLHHLKFLTVWNNVVQMVYFGLAIIYDLSKGKTLKKIIHYFFTAILVPLTIFVFLTFWGIYSIDRELIFPARLEVIIPPWHNHLLHTTILPFILIDMYLINHSYSSNGKSIMGFLSLAAIYQIGTSVIHYKTNEWPYPLLNKMAVYQAYIFFGFCWLLMISLFFLGKKLNTLIPKRNSVKAKKLR